MKPFTAKHSTCTCAMDSPLDRKKGKAPSRKKSKGYYAKVKRVAALVLKQVAV